MRDIFIFDFDGTLADSMKLAIDLYNQVGPKFGAKQFDFKDLDWARSQTYTSLMKTYRLNLANTPIIGYLVKNRMKQKLAELKMFPEVKEALEFYKSKNIRLGILTSNKASSVEEFMKLQGVEEFDFIHSVKSFFGKDKGLRKIMDLYDLDADRIVYFGDEPRDIAASHKVNIKAVGVAWGFAGITGLATPPPDLLLENPRGLVSRFEEIKNL
jgi:phosphoglycolate phosphatase